MRLRLLILKISLWAKSLFSFVGIVFVGLVGLGVLAITGTVPNTEVVPGRELSSDVKTELVNYQILDPAEEVLTFYSMHYFPSPRMDSCSRITAWFR